MPALSEYLGEDRVNSLATPPVTVGERPACGGIDPDNLLDREEGDDIVVIEMEGPPASR
jgi:hypothetical protein